MSMSFTVSCTICWVTFSSTVGKEFFLGGGSGPWLVEGNTNSVPGMVILLSNEVNLVVYQMGRLCGGAHEISGIKAQIFLHGWVQGGGGVGGGEWGWSGGGVWGWEW